MPKSFSILRLVGATVLGTALLAGCTDGNVPTELTDIPEPAFNFSNGPSNPGPRVVRFDVLPAAALFVDAERQLVALLTTGDGLLGCRAITSESPLNFQEVTTPGGVVHQLFQIHEGFGAVYDLPSFSFDCAVLTAPLAAGPVHVIGTDNDLNVSGTRTNAFGFKSNGTLDNLVGAGTIAFNQHFQALVKKDGSMETLQSDIRISPDPR